VKRRSPQFEQPQATVRLPTEPDWADITEVIRACADNKKVLLDCDSKITGDVTKDLKRGVRISLRGHKLWADPSLKLTLRMSWEVIL
jgi:hypothetical protein